MNVDKVKLAKIIDHTLLRPDAIREDVVKVCEEGTRLNFATVCVNPTWVPLAFNLLQGSGVKVDTVIGFPFGATAVDAKVFETKTAIREGAEEVDMVMNIGALKSRNYELVKRELELVVDVARESGVISKVIIEACYLLKEEKTMACELIMDSGADFVKTSTGFGKGGATVEDVRLLREVVDDKLGVKAAGGIRTYEDALVMIDAGASRIGSSSGTKIVETASYGNPHSFLDKTNR